MKESAKPEMPVQPVNFDLHGVLDSQGKVKKAINCLPTVSLKVDGYCCKWAKASCLEPMVSKFCVAAVAVGHASGATVCSVAGSSHRGQKDAVANACAKAADDLRHLLDAFGLTSR